jgi:hypothetical protein
VEILAIVFLVLVALRLVLAVDGRPQVGSPRIGVVERTEVPECTKCHEQPSMEVEQRPTTVTFRLRGDRKPESPTQQVKAAQVRIGWQGKPPRRSLKMTSPFGPSALLDTYESTKRLFPDARLPVVRGQGCCRSTAARSRWRE